MPDKGTMMTEEILEVTTAMRAGVPVVTAGGEVDVSTAPRLREQLAALPADAERVVVDLSEVTFLDSSGVHGLVTAHHAAKDTGGRLYAVAPRGTVATVLEITGVGALLSPPAGDGGPPPER